MQREREREVNANMTRENKTLQSCIVCIYPYSRMWQYKYYLSLVLDVLYSRIRCWYRKATFARAHAQLLNHKSRTQSTTFVYPFLTMSFVSLVKVIRRCLLTKKIIITPVSHKSPETVAFGHVRPKSLQGLAQTAHSCIWPKVWLQGIKSSL